MAKEGADVEDRTERVEVRRKRGTSRTETTRRRQEGSRMTGEDTCRTLRVVVQNRKIITFELEEHHLRTRRKHFYQKRVELNRNETFETNSVFHNERAVIKYHIVLSIRF